MMNLVTEREIKAVNSFEKRWKIKTNLNKFTPLHIAAKNTITLSIDENHIDFCREGTSLGLIISNGYISHVKKTGN